MDTIRIALDIVILSLEVYVLIQFVKIWRTRHRREQWGWKQNPDGSWEKMTVDELKAADKGERRAGDDGK